MHVWKLISGFFKKKILISKLFNNINAHKASRPKHKNGKKIGLTWNASANEAFLKLKRAITHIVPLPLADWDKDFVLTPDASNWAVEAALQQEGPDGVLRPLAFSFFAWSSGTIWDVPDLIVLLLR